MMNQEVRKIMTVDPVFAAPDQSLEKLQTFFRNPLATNTRS